MLAAAAYVCTYQLGHEELEIIDIIDILGMLESIITNHRSGEHQLVLPANRSRAWSLLCATPHKMVPKEACFALLRAPSKGCGKYARTSQIWHQKFSGTAIKICARNEGAWILVRRLTRCCAVITSCTSNIDISTYLQPPAPLMIKPLYYDFNGSFMYIRLTVRVRRGYHDARASQNHDHSNSSSYSPPL